MEHGRDPTEDRGPWEARREKEHRTLTGDRVSVFPHFLSTQNVVRLFACEAGAGGHLFRDWEFVGVGIARPFVEPALGRDDEEVGARGTEQCRHQVPRDEGCRLNLK